MARGRLHTTTVRFDADTWAVIVAESERLGIAHAEYIRGAVLRHAGRAVDADLGARLEAVEARAEELAAHVTLVARAVRRCIAAA